MNNKLFLRLSDKISSKLSRKLFLITFGLLIGLMTTIITFQHFFFEGFYEKQKTKSLIKQINSFKNIYSYELENSNTIYSAMFSFEEATNSKVGLYSLKENGLYLKDPKDETSYDYKVLKDFAEQMVNDNNVLYAVLHNKTITLTFYDPLSGTTKIGAVTSMPLNSKNDRLLVCIASVQPIQEATTVINRFYLYIFIGFIFLAIFISSLYSKLISNPLSKMNNVAKKMSNLDFSERCVVSTKDEIGNLANTLNFLSLNLESALSDLQHKNRQLQKDIDKERELEAMRKDFVASVSHELKTPIGIIEGYAEGIKDGIVSGEKSDLYLETIIDESKKMSKLVSNMLELSKLESGVIKPSFEVFNINRLINKVVHKHIQCALDSDLNLHFEPKTEYSYVSADIFQMEQVLTNLITNAIKYTPKNNDIIVSISEEDNLFNISVINTGSYINPEELEHLFDKFYRVDKSRQRKSNSTGLGLAIVKNILELHNFKYSLRNIDNGVEFNYYLPKTEYEDEYLKKQFI